MGSGNKGFPVQVSGTSGLYVYSHDVSIYVLNGRVVVYFTSAQNFFVSNSQSKKFKSIQKSYVPEACPRALRFSCQGPAG